MDSDKDNSKTVTVTLDQDRMYRANHADTVAITVKAGVPTEVPAWVAEEWKPKPAVTDLPTLSEELAAARAHLAELERQYADQQAKLFADAGGGSVQSTEAIKPTGKKAH